MLKDASIPTKHQVDKGYKSSYSKACTSVECFTFRLTGFKHSRTLNSSFKCKLLQLFKMIVLLFTVCFKKKKQHFKKRPTSCHTAACSEFSLKINPEYKGVSNTSYI